LEEHRKGSPIYLLHNVIFRKLKMLKKLKFKLGKLMELHGESGSTGKVKGMK
jgi:small subunit ribosomal protein S3Ae